MKLALLAIVAAAFNVGTIACIKKSKFAILNDQSWGWWIAGVVVTILATQFLVLWADVEGASIGLVVSFVIVSVMVAAAVLDVDNETGGFVRVPIAKIPSLEITGYAMAALGVALVGLSKVKYPQGDTPAKQESQVDVASNEG